MSKYVDFQNVSGSVVVCLRGPDGKIKDRKTINIEPVDNLVVLSGRQHIADQMCDQTQAAMSHMSIGTGTTAQVEGDTALETELSRLAFTSRTQGTGADAHKVVYITTWPAGTGTGAITEAGIHNASSAGDMLARVVFPVKNKGASDSLTLTWTIIFSA